MGDGGMGAVYRAHDTRYDRPVAVKILRGKPLSNQERRRRFEDDAREASDLRHPHIVTVYDIGTAEGVDFIAMELVAGRSLAEIIAGGALAPGDICRYGAQAADAVAAAHSAGVVHRDLKPTNIMVTDQGQVKVLDFALSRLGELVPDDTAGATLSMMAPEPGRTRKGELFATVGYLSPERAGGTPVEPRSDIFSLGAVLYAMATGQCPFHGQNRLAILTTILQTEPQPVRQLAPSLPRVLAKIIDRCLRKDPAKRFASMTELKAALEKAAAEPSGVLGRMARWLGGA